ADADHEQDPPDRSLGTAKGDQQPGQRIRQQGRAERERDDQVAARPAGLRAQVAGEPGKDATRQPQPEPEREQAPGERPGGSAAHCSSVRVAIESLVILSARASAIALALASHDARASVPKTLRNYALALNRDAGDAILGAPCRSA